MSRSRLPIIRKVRGGYTARKPREYLQVSSWIDPVPALIIQDELHLIREELGAFESHYEGLLAELQRSSTSEMPSKILAATATIEQYENELSQVYGAASSQFSLVWLGACPQFLHTRD